MNRTIDAGTESTASDRLREQSTALSQDLRKFGTATKEVAKEYVEHGRQKISDVGKHMAVYVGERPVKSLALATGLGIVLGYLLARRR